MAKSKAGKGEKGPSHIRYNSEGHRKRNKLRRVLKFNGPAFAEWWEKNFGK
jgi:hypothetical protein